MAGTTTYYGISYPTSTDYVKDGATAMQTIADGFDSAVAIPTYNNQTGTTYTFVLADAGKTVTSNNASAVTFTIPPQASVAWANNTTLTVRNLGAGVVTIAGGSGVTVTNTAQTVAQYGEVKLIRTASNAWTVVPASGGASGLTLITSGSVTAGTTVSFNNCFSNTYQNYRVLINGFGSATSQVLRARLRSSGTDLTSGYRAGSYGTDLGASSTLYGSSNSTYFDLGFVAANPADTGIYNFDIGNPFATINTAVTGMYVGANSGVRWQGGFLVGLTENSLSYDGLTITSANNFTATIRIYGYQNS